MAQIPAHTSKFHIGWRGLVVSVLAILGISLSIGFMFAHWTERQLLTTDNWVNLVGPLPKNDKVASALSSYSVDKLFDGADIQQQIQTALPDKVAFLAPVLAEQLHDRTTKATQKFIQSDRFSAVWITVNQTAHARLMERARHPQPNGQSKVAAFAVKLGTVADKVRSFLGKEGQASARDKAVDLKVSLNQKAQNFGRYVRLVDFLNATLWLAALVCLLGAFVLTRGRRHLLLIVSATLAIIALLQLIGINSLRPMVLDHVRQSAYRPAVGIVYDDLVANFRHSATLLFLVSGVVFLAAYFSQARFLSRSRTITRQLAVLNKSSWLTRGRQARRTVRQYHWQTSGAIAVLVLIVMAFAVDSDWQGLVRGGLVIVVAIELIHLVAARAPRRVPM